MMLMIVYVVFWRNKSAPLPGYRQTTSWVHYATSCNTQSSAPEDE